MFDKLRNRFIILNMSITAAVMLVSFLAIYFVSSSLMLGEFRRPPGAWRPDSLWLEEFDESGRAVIMDEIWQQRQEDAKRALANLRLTLLFTGLSMAAFTFIINYRFANTIIHPVREAFERQKRFIADSSHELKTPVASMMANFDVLESELPKSLDPKWTLNIKAELARMEGLIKELLDLAHLEDGARSVVKNTTLDLPEVYKKISSEFEAKIAAKGISYSLKCVPKNGDFRLKADKKLLEQILTILLDNAVKYSDESSGKIEVEIKQPENGNKKLEFWIKNNGAKIPDADKGKVFDRFYRADKSRSSEGFGLGLSIAKAAAGKIGAEISAKSDKNWTEFKVSFS